MAGFIWEARRGQGAGRKGSRLFWRARPRRLRQSQVARRPVGARRKPGVTSRPSVSQKERAMSAKYPLTESNLSTLGFAARPLDHLDALIQSHIAEGRYPGAQIALARNGKLALSRSYGD